MAPEATQKAWDRFQSDIQGLAGELKRHYRDAGDVKKVSHRSGRRSLSSTAVARR